MLNRKNISIWVLCQLPTVISKIKKTYKNTPCVASMAAKFFQNKNTKNKSGENFYFMQIIRG